MPSSSRRSAVCCCLAALAASACAPLPAAPAPGDVRAGFPSGVEWRVDAMPGAGLPPAPEDAPTLRIEDGRAAGFGGVNRWSASARVDRDAIRLADPIVTRRAGPPAAMALESAFLGRLRQAARWREDGDRLRLLDDAGRELMVLRRAGGR